jgi:Fe2+ or Zn2+ uptake regulation protein
MQTTPDMQKEMLDMARERFRDFLARKGARVTGQRMAILQAAFGMERNFIAEQLLELARRIDKSVSRATIYRSLPLLVEAGIVREIDIGGDHKFFMLDRGPGKNHVQVVCAGCEHIFEVDAPFMGWYAQGVARKLGLKAESIRIQVTAACDGSMHCPDCKRPCNAGGDKN